MQRGSKACNRDGPELVVSYCSDGFSLESDSDVRRVSDRVEPILVVLFSTMKRDDVVKFQVVGEIGVGGAWVRQIGFNTIDSGDGDIRLAAPAAPGFSIDNPVFLHAFGLTEVPVRKVVATADVVVVLGEGAGVEDAFHELLLAAEQGVLDDINGLQAHDILAEDRSRS